MNHSRNLAAPACGGGFCILFLLRLLAAGLAVSQLGRVTAQTFRTLPAFADGGRLSMVSANTLYGEGGSGARNTVFSLNTDGTGFRTLYTFPTGGSGIVSLLSGGTLYGTGGSSNDAGWVFALNADGTGFRTLYSFTAISYPCPCFNADGAFPNQGLILSGNTLYGTTGGGGSGGSGTVFSVNTDGRGFTVLYSFTPLDMSTSPGNNSDGALPFAGLVLSGNTLYGTTGIGGNSGWGTVFSVNADGTGFTVLHSFTGRDANYANSDGANPQGGLVLSGNTLYGTAWSGGSGGNGTVFALNTDGTGFTTLYSFTGPGIWLTGTNIDGANPNSTLSLSGNTLYGTTYHGGTAGNGAVFALNTDGTSFTNLHSFTATFPVTNSNGTVTTYTNNDGASPSGDLLLSGHNLYGATYEGGTSGAGVLFSISLPVNQPQLTITPAGASVILTWPSNARGFSLQSATNLGSTAVWTAVSAIPSIINGQNTVTNSISSTQQFFRLGQ